MSPIVWANILLVMPFILVWIAVPLWMTFKHPHTAPDFSEAHAYLAAKAQQSAAHYAGQSQDVVGQLESQLVA